MRLGIIDNGYATAAEAVKGADLVILCRPGWHVWPSRRRDRHRT